MNFFICNRYDSKKENIFILSPKSPINKDNYKLLKYPYLKNLLLKEIHNINNNEVSQNVQNSDNSEQLEIIDYPNSSSLSNNNLGNHFIDKCKEKENKNSIDNESSYYNCFSWDKIEEKNQIKMKKERFINNSNNSKNNISKTSLNIISNKNKFKLNDSEIDIDDTIKGEDNFNITKLKSINKNIGIKRKTNINLINKDNIFNKIKNVNKLPLNKKNINNMKYKSNNTFSIKRNLNKNKKYSNSNLKNKTTNCTLRYNNINSNLNINTNEPLSTTRKIDNNKLKKNNKQIININNNKNQYQMIRKNISDDNIFFNNYFQKQIYSSKSKNNINNIKNNKNVIRSIKNKIQKELIYGKNNYKIDKKK